jgi:hypothetical protein
LPLAILAFGAAGDNVSSCFYRLAADLAGVVLTKPELEVFALSFADS